MRCYLLQHNRYSREGWLVTRQLLHEFVLLRLSQEEAYRLSHTKLGNEQRRCVHGVYIAPGLPVQDNREIESGESYDTL